MKKIDKLIFKAFFGPFVLTFFVVVFILLIQYLIKYFPDLVGKGLTYNVYFELLLYFSINVTPNALPLALLISSLMAYGNLGEHFELTAIKSAGISLIRTFLPIFLFAIILCFVAFYINNTIVPKANLKAFSLLYDIRQKKPTFDFKEGAFYNGLPGYSIKVNKKFKDGKTMKDIMIYNHSAGRGNIEIVTADSGQMYMLNNDRYLVMELYNGQSVSEVVENAKPTAQQFARNQFSKSKIVFSMESFSMQRTQEELFASHKIMRNVDELKHDFDSLRVQVDTLTNATFQSVKPFYSYNFKVDTLENKEVKLKSSFYSDTNNVLNVLRYATNSARSIKSYMASQNDRVKYLIKDANSYEIEWYKKYTMSFACLIMFLIGAPLGAIIKKGGLGVPILVSIIFFIIYYVFALVAEKWAKEGLFDIAISMWFTNLVFFPIGLFFLRQARNDSRILETDYFAVLWDNIKNKFAKK